MKMGPIEVKPHCDWFAFAKNRKFWFCLWCRALRKTLKPKPPSECLFD